MLNSTQEKSQEIHGGVSYKELEKVRRKCKDMGFQTEYLKFS